MSGHIHLEHLLVGCQSVPLNLLALCSCLLEVFLVLETHCAWILQIMPLQAAALFIKQRLTGLPGKSNQIGETKHWVHMISQPLLGLDIARVPAPKLSAELLAFRNALLELPVFECHVSRDFCAYRGS